MRTAFRLAILAAIVASSAGCISPDLLKSQSAGQTGCAPAAIEVYGSAGGHGWLPMECDMQRKEISLHRHQFRQEFRPGELRDRGALARVGR